MSAPSQKCKRFLVVCRGENDTELMLAFAEAVIRIQAGYRCGHFTNDPGAYYFHVSDDVRPEEVPA
jgi:hypothetical protein